MFNRDKPIATDEIVNSRLDRVMNPHKRRRAEVIKHPASAKESTPVLVQLPAVIKQAKVEEVVTNVISDTVYTAKEKVAAPLMELMDIGRATTLSPEELLGQMMPILEDVLIEKKIIINLSEKRAVAKLIVDDMLGLGPLEPLLDDETVTDILVNGPNDVYVERNGQLEKTGVIFKDCQHISNIATRIATRVGRRIDESTPMVDARLLDGSRVNIIFPPLAFKSPTISIRKFAKKRISLDAMVEQENMSGDMGTFLKLATRSRLNMIISGGTGSGKTTLLNAVSEAIDNRERIVTIEDAAELQLQQPHLVTLETRPPNLEGDGEVTIRDLLVNALRMRPDRIIIGEVRSREVIDMLQAMNTGHDGSLGTIHANTPRDALMRIENLYAMSGGTLPMVAVRSQITSAIDVIVQISRMQDGKRRITSIMEVVGMEGDVITTQELYTFDHKGQTLNGKLNGKFKKSELRPYCSDKIIRAGWGKQLNEIQ